MSTATATRPVATPSSTNFTGTLYQLRLFLRRDRIVLPLWTLVLGFLLPITYVSSIEAVYPTEADRVQFALSTAASPAEIAMYGPIFSSSEGSVTIWKAGALYTIIALAVILTVIRHTRAEEESGRAELVESASIGRYSGLTAALLLTIGASIATGGVAAICLLSGGLPVAGSVAFGGALAASGIVFAGVAGVAAQLSAGARTARGIALAVLGTTYALRAVGDAGSSHQGELSDGGMSLSWLSPQGWSLLVRPYADERWWVFVLPLVTTIALVVAAFVLLSRRDVGAGLIAERPGPPTASAALSGALGLAWRMHRGTVVAWTAGLTIYGLLIGSVAEGIGGQIGDSQAIVDVIERAGGPHSIELSFIGFGFTMLGYAAAAFAISAALRMYSEEGAQRGESVLSGAVGRVQWAASHLFFALLGPAVAIAIAGVAAGLAYGSAVGDIGGTVPEVLGAALVQLPAVWLLGAVTVALFGLLPRFTPVAWAVLVAFIVILIVGSIAKFPQLILDLEPFSHLPKLPGGEFEATPVIALLALDAALIAAGLVGFRRRDLR